jgi:vacuolar-type H+-ATPase subunit I/STV1
MGSGLVLLAIGAILRYAVKDSISAVDLPTVGLILMIVGAVAFVVGAIYAFGHRDPYDRPPPPPRDPRV